MNPMNIIRKRSWWQYFYCETTYDLPELQDFFDNPDHFLQSHRVAVFKEKPGDTTKVVRVQIAGHDFVVKRYNIKGLKHWLRRCLLPSRAMVSWCNSLRLIAAGIPTTKPVAVIERRFGPLRGAAFFVTEYQEGMVANEFFRSSPDYWQYGDQVREAINQMTESLHAAGLTHDDWQFHNILLVDRQPMVLDLDHMRYFSQPTKKFQSAKNRDWDRLRRSAEMTVQEISA